MYYIRIKYEKAETYLNYEDKIDAEDIFHELCLSPPLDATQMQLATAEHELLGDWVRDQNGN